MLDFIFSLNLAPLLWSATLATQENYLINRVGIWLQAHNPFSQQDLSECNQGQPDYILGSRVGAQKYLLIYLKAWFFFSPTQLIPYKTISLGSFTAYIPRIPFHIYSFLWRRFSHVNCKSKQSPPPGPRDNVLHSTHTCTQLLMFQPNKISHPNRNHLANVITSHLHKSVSL